ncbi:hypothetical protein [Streptomyces sp. NPDC046759]|uniref:hypothetical protein n=1 Tax=Streptomyces sp. NPDC046759 TaxID=3155019 RepID=UPI0033E57AD6
MRELILSLGPGTRQAVDDLADATGRSAEETVLAAVHRYLHEERVFVRTRAERLAHSHADLLRRLGE